MYRVESNAHAVSNPTRHKSTRLAAQMKANAGWSPVRKAVAANTMVTTISATHPRLLRVRTRYRRKIAPRSLTIYRLTFHGIVARADGKDAMAHGKNCLGS
jgi:hypothetical protein